MFPLAQAMLAFWDNPNSDTFSAYLDVYYEGIRARYNILTPSHPSMDNHDFEDLIRKLRN